MGAFSKADFNNNTPSKPPSLKSIKVVIPFFIIDFAELRMYFARDFFGVSLSNFCFNPNIG